MSRVRFSLFSFKQQQQLAACSYLMGQLVFTKQLANVHWHPTQHRASELAASTPARTVAGSTKISLQCRDVDVPSEAC